MSRLKALIVGLGNPGEEYEDTRHNLGFLVVEELARQWRVKLTRHAILKGQFGRADVGGKDVFLLLPLTYVNNSGEAVAKAAAQKNIDFSDVLVICDDLNLDFGTIRLRKKGSAGGHNGLKSIIEHLNTQDFVRLRLGIGSPAKKEETVEFVLGQFNAREKKELKGFVNQAAECCSVWLKEGTSKAASQPVRRVPS